MLPELRTFKRNLWIEIEVNLIKCLIIIQISLAFYWRKIWQQKKKKLNKTLTTLHRRPKQPTFTDTPNQEISYFINFTMQHFQICAWLWASLSETSWFTSKRSQTHLKRDITPLTGSFHVPTYCKSKLCKIASPSTLIQILFLKTPASNSSPESHHFP